MAADLILLNGKVITVDGDFHIAEALAVTGGRLTAIGSSADVAELRGPKTEVIDAAGRAVVPGFIDGHAHMDREGLKTLLPSMAGVKSIEDILTRIKALVDKAQPGEWITTMPLGDPPHFRCEESDLAEGRFPNRHDLDKVAPDNPVYIRSIWGPWRHSFPLVSIANSRALAMANVTKDSEPPESTVEIDRDSDGAPTGIFRDNNLYPLVEFTLMRAAPRFSISERATGIKRSMRIYNSFGTTSVFEGHGAAGEVIEAYKAVRAEDAATVRAHLVFSPSWRAMQGASIPDLMKTWGSWLGGRGLGDDYLRVGGLFVDLEKKTDADPRMDSLPYTGWSGFYYDSAASKPVIQEVLNEAARNNIRAVAIIREFLPLYEEAAKVAPLKGKRWVLSHINILDDDDVDTCERHGLVLTSHTNRYVLRESAIAAERLGPEKARFISPMNTLRNRGVSVNLGTDNVPVSLFNCLESAITRSNQQGKPVVAPEECLSREDGLRCATINGARMTFEEDVKGSLEVGKFADFAVLSADPLTCDDGAIKDIVAEKTVVGGRVVFERN